MLKGIWGLLAALPQLLGLLERVLAGINAWLEERWREKQRKALDEAAKKAKETKNTCDLEKLLDPDKKC